MCRLTRRKYLCWIGVFYIPMPLMMWCMSGTVNFFVFNLIYNDFLAAWKKLRLSIPHDSEQVAQILADCVRITGLQDAYVEMLCTRGRPPSGSRDPRDCVINSSPLPCRIFGCPRPTRKAYTLSSATHNGLVAMPLTRALKTITGWI